MDLTFLHGVFSNQPRRCTGRLAARAPDVFSAPGEDYRKSPGRAATICYEAKGRAATICYEAIFSAAALKLPPTTSLSSMLGALVAHFCCQRIGSLIETFLVGFHHLYGTYRGPTWPIWDLYVTYRGQGTYIYTQYSLYGTYTWASGLIGCMLDQ